jgi:hypothetical protein
MEELLPSVTYDQMLRAARAVRDDPNQDMIEVAILEEFEDSDDPGLFDLYNAVTRRMIALVLLLKGSRAAIKRHNLSEHSLLQAAAVAPLNNAQDTFEAEAFIELAKSFPAAA